MDQNAKQLLDLHEISCLDIFEFEIFYLQVQSSKWRTHSLWGIYMPNQQDDLHIFYLILLFSNTYVVGRHKKIVNTNFLIFLKIIFVPLGKNVKN